MMNRNDIKAYAKEMDNWHSSLPDDNDELKNLYRNIVEKSYDGIIAASREMIVIYSNNAANQFINTHHRESLLGNKIQLDEVTRERLIVKGHAKTEIPITTWTGELGWAEMIIVKNMLDGLKDMVYYISLRDITDRYILERDLEMAYAKENERAKEISDLRKLEYEITRDAHVKQWKELAIDLNHETRTAVSSIINILDTMKFVYNNDSKNEKDINELINACESAAFKIKSVLQGFADLAKTKSKVEPEIFNAAHEIEREISFIRNTIVDNSVNIVLKYDKDLYIKAIKYQFKMIVKNLIENAVKACYQTEDSSGEVLIEVKELGNRVNIIISDDGIGIPEKLIPLIGNVPDVGEFEIGDKRGMRFTKVFCKINNIDLDIKSSHTKKYKGKYVTVFTLDIAKETEKPYER